MGKIAKFISKLGINGHNFVWFLLLVLFFVSGCSAISDLPATAYSSLAHYVYESNEKNVTAELYCQSSDGRDNGWYPRYQFSYEDVLKVAKIETLSTVYRQYYVRSSNFEDNDTFFSSTFAFAGTPKARNVRAISADVDDLPDGGQKIDAYFGCTFLCRDTREGMRKSNAVVLSYRMASDYLELEGKSMNDVASIIGKEMALSLWESNNSSLSSTAGRQTLYICGVLNPTSEMTSAKIDFEESDFCFLSYKFDLTSGSTIIDKMPVNYSEEDKALSIRFLLKEFQKSGWNNNTNIKISFYTLKFGVRTYIFRSEINRIQDVIISRDLVETSILWWVLFAGFLSAIVVKLIFEVKRGAFFLLPSELSPLGQFSVFLVFVSLLYFCCFGCLQIVGTFDALVLGVKFFHLGLAPSVFLFFSLIALLGFLSFWDLRKRKNEKRRLAF